MKQNAVKIGLMVAMLLSLMVGNAEWSEALEVRSGNSYGDFQVMFEPLKPTYNVGEHIQFRIKGNKTFYLYLFSIDSRQNRGYVLLPNVLQQYHKYSANTEYLVPEKNVEFYSEQPGTERIIMLASTEKLDIKLEKYAKSGNLFASEAFQIEQEVKSLRVRSKKKETQKVTRELSLVILGDGRRSGRVPPPANTPPGERQRVSAFVSSDRTGYRAGDTMKISFGADKEGFVYLFSIEPDGRRTLLTKQAVTGHKFYQVAGRATLPGGEHSLIAVYNERNDLNADDIRLPNFGQKSKGIELLGDWPESYAVYHLNVTQ
ncbi:MAG: hypothetical protein DRI57_00315 [Deltaproteobacteria bacterium]|nr:MAG: hypothetical protein DRI57_00315 [Deltaproteobacteria bacterium]